MNLPSLLHPLGSVLLIVAITVSLLVWTRLARKDARLPTIYLLGLLGGFLGAKLGFIFAEWRTWIDTPYFWPQMLAGKTIVGALLGGYFFVELAKRQTGYGLPTGDLFALTAPLGIVIGRIGCLVSGCCLGQVCPPTWYSLRDAAGETRWPAVPLEIIFNLLLLLIFLMLRRFRALPGQHFHLYLMAYGGFRFLHEFARDTPRLIGPFSGYHVLAGLLILLGGGGFLRRRAKSPLAHPANDPHPAPTRLD